MPTENDPFAGVNGSRIIARRSCQKAFDCNQAMIRARCGQRISHVAILKNALENKNREISALLLRQPKLKTGKQFAPCPRIEQTSRQVTFLKKRPPAKYGRRKIGRTNQAAYPRAFFNSGPRQYSAHTLPFSS